MQNLKNHPFDETTFKKKKLTLTDGKLGIYFEGKLTDSNKITGTFKQRGKSIPLTLVKSYGVINNTKPQTPIAPYPYKSKQVSFSNQDGKIKFSGTITYPNSTDSNQKFPSVILFTGSGAQDRDESIGNHKPFAVISDYLSKAGYAVLRVDDRGAGFTKASPDKLKYTTEDLIEDGDAYFKFLVLQPMVNTNKIFLVGHSEGGSIATGVAKKNPSVAGIIGLAPMLATWLETNTYQNYWALKNGGVDSLIIENYLGLHLLLLSKLINEHKIPNDSISETIIRFCYNQWKTNAAYGTDKMKKKVISSFEKVYKVKLLNTLYTQYTALFTNPWMFNMFKVTPSAELVQLKLPILVLQGKLDQQISYTQSENVVKVLQTVGRNIQIELFENHNHLLQHCKTGNVNEYFDNQESFSPEVLEAITNWLKAN
jgi:pimeloyl-ACP methyl ester carboxylesterase